MKLSDNLKTIRKENNLSQEQFDKQFQNGNQTKVIQKWTKYY